MKVIYSPDFGSELEFSEKGVEWLKEHGMPEDNIVKAYPRHHPLFIQMYEELGDEGFNSRVNIKEVNKPYFIVTYDGSEEVCILEEDFSFFIPKPNCLDAYHIKSDTFKLEKGLCTYKCSTISCG